MTTQATGLNGVQVLLVDDDHDSLELIKVVLEQDGAIVTTVSSAKQALETLAQTHFDLLVSDIGMPEMDGYELLRQLHVLLSQQEQMSQTVNRTVPKAIALTAFAGERDQQQALEVGYQIHLSKPIEPERLIAAITNLMRS